MPLRIDTTKCDLDERTADTYTRTIADIMYSVGVGQIRNEDEAKKLYRRYYMSRLAANQIPHAMSLVPFHVMRRFIGAHTNVSDVSDFQFNKGLIHLLTSTADAKLAFEETL